MTIRSIERTFAATQIATALLLVTWWMLMGFALPVQAAQNNFARMIAHANWVPVNIIGMLACVAWLFSLPIHVVNQDRAVSLLRFVALLISGAGVVWFGCIQYYETFLWPVVVAINPELVQLKGPLVFGDRLVLVPLLLSGLTVAAGYLVLMADQIRSRSPHTGSIVLLGTGALVFANGIVFPVRTVGILVFATAMVWHGVLILRKTVDSHGNKREYQS